MALTTAPTSWWRRNRLWLALLLPLLALAVASSSWAYFRLYRTQQYHQAHRATDGTVHLVHPTRDTGFDYTIDVTMHLVRVEKVTDGSWSVPPGQTLWRSVVRFEADPEALLNGCRVSLLDRQGRRFVPGVGMKAGAAARGAVENECVPRDHSGPAVIAGKVLPPNEGEERPPSWESTRLWALPDGAEPGELRIAWSPPHYAALPVS
ncbi:MULTISPECIES: hypothetical protein [unclassified Luteococcus]|uniref:hypothetical protein n=1 Tax=unclassified Luteococcus TaxID=2639923 RepID=UPI00313C3DF9